MLFYHFIIECFNLSLLYIESFYLFIIEKREKILIEKNFKFHIEKILNEKLQQCIKSMEIRDTIIVFINFLILLLF